MATELLSYGLLEARCREYFNHDESEASHPVGLWVFALGILGGILGTLLFNAFHYQAWLYLAVAGAWVEWFGVAIWSFYSIRSMWHVFRRQHQNTAENLDRSYAQYRQWVDWLRQFPAQDLARHQRFIRDRKAAFLYRYGLVIGSAERLGILPVLVVLYLQFKDWQFGDWQALAQVHYVGGFFLGLIAITYGAGWFAVRDKVRVDFYEAILAEACLEDDASDSWRGAESAG